MKRRRQPRVVVVCETCGSVCDARCRAEARREAQRLAALAVPILR